MQRFSAHQRMFKVSAIANCLVIALLTNSLFGESNWNRFRGDNGSGVMAQCTAPLPWNDSDVAWRIDLPGRGHGSPIIQGDRAYLLSADPTTAERYVIALDLASGKEIWKKNFASQTHKLHKFSSYASSTPCADSKAVYVAWGAPTSLTVKAFSHAGEELWSQDLGRHVSGHGFGGSPMRVGDYVIVLDSQDAEELPPNTPPGNSSVVALQADTGKLVWRTPLATKRTCYSVPSITLGPNGNELVLVNETAEGICGIDVKTGQAVWKRSVFSKRSVSSPLVVGNLVIGTEGSGGGGNILFAVDMNNNHELLFDIRRSAPYVPTPVALGNLLFMWEDKGIVSCVELPSGQVVWSQRIGGNTHSSPVIAGDKLLGVAEDGTVNIVSAARDYKFVGKVKLPLKVDETVRATPALREDCVLIRTDSQLFRIGLAKK